ncbi:phosphatidylinositol-glycan biosynthesis class X protein [Helicoverpa zea]|uniref:Phosphatidylinositol-glycan biosynthesis class X protein n=1 Tax=Helicoverpa armigera TaxID=29058 RepID=A0A2W1BMQ1_HELAM|nr:phosphatidylinositol-glycan biosynthesis class X protein [Helicoverpa zea]PZC74894.1 hypothetical protein B5X24_HaOG207057 [Helicoverpa armigera]
MFRYIRPIKLINLFICFLVFLCCFHYLSANACDFDVKLKQVLKNQGFHRNITYGIVFNSDEDQCWLYKDCVIGLDQTLPHGVYANPDELSTLRRMRKLNAVPKNRINTELPAEHSYPTTTYITERIKDCKVYLWLPVHARYHLATPGGGMARNTIGPPKLYLRCPDERLEMCNKDAARVNFLCNGSSKEKCSWKELPYTLLTDTLVWPIPIGNMEHLHAISIGTAVVVAVGSLYLIKAIHEHKLVTMAFNPYGARHD